MLTRDKDVVVPNDVKESLRSIGNLGCGATSRVDKARDTVLGRTVALKTLVHSFGAPTEQKQFLREAQIVSQLSHPAIVNLYDVGIEDGNVAYLVMEYVAGEDAATGFGGIDGADADTARVRVDFGSCGCVASRASLGRDSWRYQAGEYFGDRRRKSEAERLRHRALCDAGFGLGTNDGNAGVFVAGTDFGRAAEYAIGFVFTRESFCIRW